MHHTKINSLLLTAECLANDTIWLSDDGEFIACLHQAADSVYPNEAYDFCKSEYSDLGNLLEIPTQERDLSLEGHFRLVLGLHFQTFMSCTIVVLYNLIYVCTALLAGFTPLHSLITSGLACIKNRVPGTGGRMTVN